MGWQLAVVWVLIALAGAYVARATWRTWFGTGRACGGGGCGACAAPPAPPPERRLIPLERADRDGGPGRG
ncbi:MAG TPA: hypothetical protein VIL46_12015 [Gemmataceae bacterium]